MEIQSIFAWKALPKAGFGKNVVIDAHRCSGSRIHLDHRSAGRSAIQDQSSDHHFKRLHLTRASVRRASGFVLTGYPETELWRAETSTFRTPCFNRSLHWRQTNLQAAPLKVFRHSSWLDTQRLAFWRVKALTDAGSRLK
jgi:hypothetical protein